MGVQCENKMFILEEKLSANESVNKCLFYQNICKQFILLHDLLK